MSVLVSAFRVWQYPECSHIDTTESATVHPVYKPPSHSVYIPFNGRNCLEMGINGKQGLTNKLLGYSAKMAPDQPPAT